MRLLLTNDDGIEAPGIRALYEACSTRENTEIAVAAPKVQHSGTSVSISVHKDIGVECLPHYFGEENTWAIYGTPADCVKLALSSLTDALPDWILSGVNCGSNAGANVFYSGTVGALVEGALRGVPGIAFSCVGTERDGFQIRPDGYEVAKHFISPILDTLSGYKQVPGTIFNVNIPALPIEQIKGVRLASQGRDYWMDRPLQTMSEGNICYYSLGSLLSKFPPQSTADCYLLQQGYITCVPLQYRDITDHAYFQSVKEHFDSNVLKSSEQTTPV